MAKQLPKNRTVKDPGGVRRLKDQLKVYKEIKEIHLNRRKLDEMAFYPAHDPRKETPAYKKVHHHLVVELDCPCLVCGVKNSTLKDPAQNRYDAKQMETHHHVIEWALANAIDTQKFNQRVLPHLKARHPDRPDYQANFTDQQVRDWVDHDPDNLWVLCDVHHRAARLGIHEISFPIWGPMDLLIDNFEQYVREQIAKEKGAGKKTSRKSAPSPKKAKKKGR